MSKKHTIIALSLLVLVFVAALTLYAISQRNQPVASKEPAKTTTVAADYTEPTAAKPGTQTYELTIDKNSIISGPKTITVARDASMHIIFHGTGTQSEGDIMISGYDLTVPTVREYTTSMEFKAAKAGTYPITLNYQDEEQEEAEERGDAFDPTENKTVQLGTLVVTD